MNSERRAALAFAAILAAIFLPLAARASVISVVNPSFEDPAGPYPFGCGTNCSYSGPPISGWTGTTDGYFIPTGYFNSVPDGKVIAYVNTGDISQTVSAVAHNGVTYTLLTDVGVRGDGYQNLGVVDLIIGGNTVQATGTAASNWQFSTYTASYTATAADEGSSIAIALGTGPITCSNAPVCQAEFDNVRLSGSAGSVPEPAAWALILAGLGMTGAALRRRPAAMTA